MSDILTSLQEARKNYTELKTQAESAMQTEFESLLTQAAAISTEFNSEFGGKLKLPATVLKFTVNTKVKTRRKAQKKVTAASTGTPAEAAAGTDAPAQPNSRKIAGLKKSFKSLTSKIAIAKAAGKSTKDLEDNLYGVTDDLRLAGISVDDLAVETPTPVAVPVAPPQPQGLGAVHPF